MARPSSALEPSYPPGGTVATLWCTTAVVVRYCHCDPENGSSGRLDCTYTRPHYPPQGVAGGAFDPSQPRFRGLVHRFVRSRTKWRFPLKGNDSVLPRVMDPLGFEPRASSLQRRHSTAELWARVSLGSSRVPGRSDGGWSSAKYGRVVSHPRRGGLGRWR